MFSTDSVHLCMAEEMFSFSSTTAKSVEPGWFQKKTDYFFHGAGSRNALRRCTRSCYLRRTSHRIALFPSCAPTGRGHSSLCHDEAGLRSLSECGDFFYVVQGCIDGRGLKISKKPKHENIMGAA